MEAEKDHGRKARMYADHFLGGNFVMLPFQCLCSTIGVILLKRYSSVHTKTSFRQNNRDKARIYRDNIMMVEKLRQLVS